MTESIGEIILKQEREYTRGTIQISKYVSHSMYDTLNRSDAYLNSQHIYGETDSQGRLKPFLNISTTAANVWFKATDIDTRHIRIFSKNRKNWINSFFINVILQDWIKREKFGQFLNEWGRVMSRHNSAMLKIIKNSKGLSLQVVPWNRLIVDQIDADQAPKIEVLELSEAELKRRIKTHQYDKDAVKKLIGAKKERETLDKHTKDNKSDYYKLYELHGELPEYHITDEESDDDFVWQTHVISFVGGRDSKKDEPEEFTLYRGRTNGDPYLLTHLLKEDGRTLAIGPVELLFNSQWIQNHAAKSIKDQLDIASKLLLQTADPQFLGRNVLNELENGDILIHSPNMPLTQVHNASHDIVSWQNYATQFKNFGQELVGVSDALLGQQPKSGTAWRLQETILNEAYSLFEVFTENKGLYLVQILREHVLPYLLKQYDNNKEIASLLEKQDLEKIDKMFVKAEAARRINDKILKNVSEIVENPDGNLIGVAQRDQLIQQEETKLQEQLNQFGNQRFFAPDKISWKEQLKDAEWDIEIEVTNEQHNMQEMLSTLNTALNVAVQPGFDQNPRAQHIVGKILELTGAMSPVEFYAIPSTAMPREALAAGSGVESEQAVDKQRNIQNA